MFWYSKNNNEESLDGHQLYEGEVDLVKGQTHLDRFFSGNNPTVKSNFQIGKPKRHPKSLIKAESIRGRILDSKESIFDIIMPWRAELAAEEVKKNKSHRQEKQGLKQTNLLAFMPQKQKSGKAKSSQDSTDKSKKDGDETDEEEKMIKASKVHKLKEIESIKY